VIIDTDVASDDWMAILFLLRHPKVSVKGITVTGTGEAHSEPGGRIALGLLSLAGNPSIPVALGSETPLGFGHPFPGFVREMVDSAMGIPLPLSDHAPLDQDAVEFLISYLDEAHSKVVLLALGPLTNLAQVFRRRPSVVEKVDMLYVMGGAVGVPGNVFESSVSTEGGVAEWNIYCDPLAARRVFHSGVPITLVPLDATNQVPVTQEFYRKMEENHTTPEANFVLEVLKRSLDYLPTGRMFFWDPLAAAVLTDPSMATFEQTKLTVIASEGSENGRTAESPTGACIQVCTGVDGARFEELFLDALNGRL
jgi:inosine-uridine nucleoside N-ribohydrolase